MFQNRIMRIATAALLPMLPVAAAAQNDDTQEIVVTGTRSTGRAALSSPVPVDVVGGTALRESGYDDLSRALEYSSPSVNFARSATTATAANTRPVTLRGMSPDQTLVLVNGKRRHATAILNVNNAIGRGAAAVDLNQIPAAAIERVEILRDGAAAQYGSDAIAGVVNVILKADDHGGFAAIQSGLTEAGDGGSVVASGRIGLDLGGRGHATISAEARYHDITNRAELDRRFGRVTFQQGDPRSTDTQMALDAAYQLDTGEIYAFGTLGRRLSENPAQFRLPTVSPVLYPAGFVPQIKPTITDAGLTAGWRATFGDGWRFDASHTFGWDDADFHVRNSANASLGAASPTRFDAGGVSYRQHVSDLSLSHAVPVLAGGNIAAGLQHRRENFRIRTSESAAYVGTGAEGFAGFNPSSPIDRSRNAFAGFLDAELSVTPYLSFGAAARYDHYSDFGSRTTWKGTGRLELTDNVALRGAVSSGFRAPSLQQQYFSAVQGASSAGTLVTVGTLPVADPTARALGARALKPEKSRNLSAGIVVTPGSGFSLTADWFHVAIDDRIVLSEQLSGAAVVAALRAAGITNFQQVRFFTNAIDTTTQGFELNARWQGRIADRIDVNAGLGYGRFVTGLDRLAANQAIPSLPLLGIRSLTLATKGQPKDKLTASLNATMAPFTLQLGATRFGEYQSVPFTGVETYGTKVTLDASLRVEITPGLSLTAGVLNLGNTYPDRIRDTATVNTSSGGSFVYAEETPFGVGGREYFLRAEMKF